MARKKSPKKQVDLLAGFRGIGGQFRNLDTRDPGSWPPAPQYLLFIAIAGLVVLGLWFAWLRGVDEELVAEREKETALRADYQAKVQKAASLEELKRQLEQVRQYVALLEKQLPSKAEMDALLSDINQAGLGRSLQFDLFRPGQLVVKEYYAELPIAVKVTGRYHDIGAFASDIAHLSRIVTLNNVNINPSGGGKSDNLILDATVKTFRYLDPEEVQAQRQATNPGGQR